MNTQLVNSLVQIIHSLSQEERTLLNEQHDRLTPQVMSPPTSDAENKQNFLKSLIERMQQNSIPLNAPRFTRDMLYERS
ncbi:hypothetical protein F7734_17425 [Scytonema sp. UIC 10036]|uniref:hypothetical protein n=1 Tax=Scytonema sp. UIC 10036 TaxID=2304196 RepID=UPI0012DA06B1|nr:hypothetical protein [Scytonema sp. UIC 10036]MUG94074.1 hypothetical protein [Scytonema sp. UIC 10036]